MATNTYDIKINSAQAERALQNLQGNLGKLNNSFSGLKTAIAGLAIGNFVSQAYAMADAIADMSQALGISVAGITGFQKAILQSVNGAESATVGLGKLSQAIESAADGSKEMQDRFLKLGIGLEELKNLSPEELLGRVVQSLGKMTAGTERAAIGMALFGKSFRSADWSGIANEILDATQEAGKSADSIKAAADASDKLDVALSKLKTAIVIALAPLSEMIVTIAENKDALESLFQTLIHVATIFASLFVVEKVIALFVGLKTALSAVIAIGAATSATVAGLGAAWVRLIPIVGQVAAVFMILNEVVNLLTGNSIVDWAEKAAKALGLINETSKETKAATDAEKERQAEMQRTQEAAVNANRDVVDAMAKQREAIQKIAQDYRDTTAAANERYQSETQVIGATERQKVAVQELDNAYKEYMSNFIKLREEYNKLRVGTESEKKAAQELYPEFAKLTAEYQAQKLALADLTNERVNAVQAQQLELFKTKQLTDAQNKLWDIQDDIAKSTMSEIEKKYYDIEVAARNSAKAAIDAEAARRNAPLDPNEQRAYYEAAARGMDRLKAKTKEQYDLSRSFSTGWKKAFQEYADNAGNAAKQAERLFAKFTQGMEDLIVDFAKTGKFEWKNFVASMLEELLRSQIQQVMAKTLGMFSGAGSTASAFDVLGGMGNGSFDMTGKSPSNPMYVMDVSGGGLGGGLGGLGGQGGLLGDLGGYGSTAYGMGSLATGRGDPFGSLLSLFDLGPNATKPYETTNADSNWWDLTQADNFYEPWKNNQSSDSGGWFDSITSGASGLWDSVSSGVSDLFSGWFANGGNIPAGTFGVVGERGPELVSGPANITPFNGMGTNVTYNINAVDAASFKQLVAQDPGFIHAVAMQGASSIPRRR